MGIRACKICPILVPTLLYLGGDCLFLLRQYLNTETVFASFISSESSFHARIVEGKKELKNRLLLASK